MERVFNVNMIQAFVTVARLGSVSEAAHALHLSQPAISHQIKRLSEQTGVTLFRRVPGGVQVTRDGAALLPKAQQVLDSMDAFMRSAHHQGDQVRGRVRIGTILDPEFIRLGQMLGQLRQRFPGIETELSHGVSGQTLDRLQRGRIDAGFYLDSPEDAPLSQGAHPECAQHPLADFTYRVIAPAGWQAEVAQADWSALAALPWIGTPETSVHHRLLTPIFARLGLRQNAVARVDQESSMLEMVRSGVGLSLSRESVALHQAQSFGLAVCQKVTVPARLSLICPQGDRQGPALAAFVALVTALWREGGAG